MKIIMIYDQIQSGAGIKDDHMVPLGATKDPVGPAVMMEPYLKKVGGRVVACGTPADIAACPESVTGRFLRL